MEKARSQIEWMRIIPGVLIMLYMFLWINGRAQSPATAPVHATDTLFKKRMAVDLDLVSEPSNARFLQLVDENRRRLYPDHVKIKIIRHRKAPVVGYTREGKLDYALKNDDSIVKVVVGRYKTSLGTHKRKVFELSPWESAMRGVFVPVGKTKNFLGLKRVCPKPK